MITVGVVKLVAPLAAGETGRVPIQSPDERQAATNLSQVLGVLRRERRQQGTWSTALDLESWADFLDARSQLPRLVRRLIRRRGPPGIAPT